MASAAEEAFAIPELLENILIHLPSDHRVSFDEFEETCQLFRLQRVNRSFRSTITASPALRQKMRLDICTPRSSNNAPYLEISPFLLNRYGLLSPSGYVEWEKSRNHHDLVFTLLLRVNMNDFHDLREQSSMLPSELPQPQPSWARTRCFSSPGSLRVDIEYFQDHGTSRQAFLYSLDEPDYTEHIRLESGVTVGELIRVLESSSGVVLEKTIRKTRLDAIGGRIRVALMALAVLVIAIGLGQLLY